MLEPEYGESTFYDVNLMRERAIKAGAITGGCIVASRPGVLAPKGAPRGGRVGGGKGSPNRNLVAGCVSKPSLEGLCELWNKKERYSDYFA